MQFEIRPARVADAPKIAELTAQLGYHVPTEEVAARLSTIASQPDHAVFVACNGDGNILGWMDIGITFHLQSGHYCEIGGLVVADGARNQGIGRQLVAFGEEWGAKNGVKKILVRSNAKRADAHRFYLREKYEMVKTSAVFEKRL
jgi:GNAT superfamily N-acetyltransferase